LNVTVEDAAVPNYPTLPSGGFYVVSFWSNSTTANTQIVNPISKYVTSTVTDGVFATQISPSVSASLLVQYVQKSVIDLYRVIPTHISRRTTEPYDDVFSVNPASLRPGFPFYMSHRRTSSVSSLNQYATVAVSMPTAPLLFDAPGSMNVALTAFRHKFAYFKLNVPADRIINATLSVSFTSGSSSDTIQVDSSGSRWPNGRNGATSTLVNSGIPKTIQITACNMDFKERMVYLNLVFRPALWTVDELNAGTRQVSVSFSFSGTANHVNLPANVTIQVPAGTTRVFKLTSVPAARARGGQLVVQQTPVSAAVVLGAPNSIAVGDTCISTNGKGISFSASYTNYICPVMDQETQTTYAIVTGPTTFGYNIKEPRQLPLSGTQTFTFLADGSDYLRISGPSNASLYPIIVRAQPQFVDFAIYIDTYKQNHYVAGCSSVQSYITRDWGYSDNNQPETIVLPTPFDSIFMSTYGGGTGRIIIDASLYSTTTSGRYSFTLSGNFSQTFAVPADSPLILALEMPAGSTYDVSVYSSLPAGFPEYVQGADRTTGTYFNSTLSTLSIGGAGSLIIPGTALPITVFVEMILKPTCILASPAVVPTACVGKISGAVAVSDYSVYSATSRVGSENTTFCSLYPSECASNSACYNAFLQESCLRYVPRCEVTGIVKRDGCSDQCLERMSSAGCTSNFAKYLCVQESGDCLPIPVLSDAPALAPRPSNFPPTSDIFVPDPPSNPPMVFVSAPVRAPSLPPVAPQTPSPSLRYSPQLLELNSLFAL
jgi:hypothetical protein